MRLKYQLFVILLVASATLIASLYAFNNWSFNRGFVEYQNRSQIQALTALSSSLAESYAENGSWNWVIENPHRWRRLVDASLNQSSSRWKKSDQYSHFRDTRPVDRRPPPERAPRIPELRELSVEPAPPIRPHSPPEQRIALILADANKKIILGRLPDRTIQWMPIQNETEIIGFLGYSRKDRLPRKIDQAFAEQQKNSFALASLLMIVLSAILAAILASRIVKPVITVSKAVSEISQGDYTHRVETKRRDELGDLSRDVNQLAHTLEQGRTARRRWIAEISHELRTPVAILQGELEAIQDGLRPFNTTTLASLHTETLRLSHLIQDLHDLSLSDIGALEYQMAPMNVKELLEQRLAATEAQLAETNLKVELQAPDKNYSIYADQHRMGQLLDNLLQNSLRHTDPGGHIVISLKQQNNRLHILWMDSSPGLSDADLPQLFDPLYRAEPSRNRHDGGSGLGLTIVQKIITAHQGKISASHSPLGGLQIDIDLPLHNAL